MPTTKWANFTDVVRWSDYPSASTYLSTELNSLAAGSNALGAAIDNSTAGRIYADYELYLAANGTARLDGCYVGLYVLPSVDGTNYAYGSATMDPSFGRLVANIQPDASASACYSVVIGVVLPAGKYKVLVDNQTGASLMSTGNTLKYVVYDESIE